MKPISDSAIVTASYGPIKIWSLYETTLFHNTKCLHKLTEHSHWVSACEITQSGNLLSGSFDKTLKLWDINSGKCLNTYQIDQMVYNMKLLPSNKSIAAIAADQNILLYDLNNKSIVKLFENAHDGIIFNVLPFGNESEFLATCSQDKTIKIWRIQV